MQNSRTGLMPGALVEARGRRWRLVDSRRFERCSLLTLQGVDRGDIGDTLRVLTPFDRVVARRRHPHIRLAGRLAVGRRVADAVLTSHPWRACWTAATANITLLPWQLEPALAVLGGATRVLLADAVGLGKTIQAGLILAELAAHGLLDRTLVLTPAGLRAQWADELAVRFGLRATILDQAALAREAAHLPPDVSPWATPPIVISSIDLVKRPEVLTAVDRVPFDLVIVDEAHHLTPASDRGAVVERIARRTPWVVLISATPHSGDERAFAYLTNIGSVGHDLSADLSADARGAKEEARSAKVDRLSVFRRSVDRRDRRTRAKLVAVRTSAAESALLEDVQDYAKAIWRDCGAANPAARLVAIVLARRAASSADALLATLRRRQSLLIDGPTTAMADQASLPWEELDEGDGDEPDHVLMTPGLARADEERRRLEHLIALAHRARDAAAKPVWIQRFLGRAREPAIVFSEYRDTIDALHARFAPLLPVETLHGGLSPAMRHTATARFVDGPAMLLLATDTGGEGLNLHARCRTVINNELPWNPLRLEQRVGRVDRIGQRRPVHAVHLMHAGSVEQTVLAHLHRRATRAGTLAGSTGLDVEALVAEAVLGGTHLPSLTVPDRASAEVNGASDEARRLDGLRTLTRSDRTQPSASIGSSDAVPVSAPRRTARPARKLLCAFQVALVDESGRGGATEIVPVSIALASPLPSSRRALLLAVRDLTNDSRVREAVAAAATAALRPSRDAARDIARAIDGRVSTLLAAWNANGQQLYQPALFDGRSSRLAAERSAVHDIHRRHLQRVARGVDGFDRLTTDAPVLVGAWLEC